MPTEITSDAYICVVAIKI